MAASFESLVALGCSQQLVLLFFAHLEAFLLFVLESLQQFFILYAPFLYHRLFLRRLTFFLLQLRLALQEVIHHQVLLLLLLCLFILFPWLLFCIFLLFCLPVLQILEHLRPDDHILKIPQSLNILYIELVLL